MLFTVEKRRLSVAPGFPSGCAQTPRHQPCPRHRPSPHADTPDHGRSAPTPTGVDADPSPQSVTRIGFTQRASFVVGVSTPRVPRGVTESGGPAPSSHQTPAQDRSPVPETGRGQTKTSTSTSSTDSTDTYGQLSARRRRAHTPSTTRSACTGVKPGVTNVLRVPVMRAPVAHYARDRPRRPRIAIGRSQEETRVNISVAGSLY